jgi:protein-L-isoaspartate(D-aspartate) O-methyltransferase
VRHFAQRHRYNRAVRPAVLLVLFLLACDAAPPDPPPRDPPELAAARARMVEEQVRPFGVTDERVLEAMRSVLRHEFLPEDLWERAYADGAVKLPDGATVTAPDLSAFVVASLRLDGDSRVLECGTRTGWITALLSSCSREVVTVAPRSAETDLARRTLGRLGCRNVRFLTGDPLAVPPDEGPFDAILLNGHVRHVPKALYGLLRTGGRILAPVGWAGEPQTLILVVKGEDGPESTRALLTVRYVPLAR